MTPSTLDELKTAWLAFDRKLERQHALIFHQFKETRVAKMRGGFRTLVIGQIFQTAIGLLLALFGGSFWFDHVGRTHLVVYGLLLHAFGIMMMVFGIRELCLIKTIDYDGPVLAMQKQLAKLRSWRLRAAIWFAVAGSFIWVPAILVLFYLIGADLWVNKRDVVFWNVASTVVCLGICYAVVWWSRRPGQERFAQKLRENSVGKRITRAHEMLEEIGRFEMEDGTNAVRP